MNFELIKTILFFISGGFLIFLAITLTRDNFSHRLNRITGAMLAFAGIGPIFMALGSVISQSNSASFNIEDSYIYDLAYLWEFFFPCLLAFSWIYPVDRFRQFKHPRLLYLVFIPTIIHLFLMLSFDQIAAFLSAFEIDTTKEGISSLILVPLSKIFSWILLIISYIHIYHLQIFGALNLLYVFLAVFFLESGKMKISNPRLLSQTKAVLWGTRIGLGLFVISQLGSNVLPYRIPEPISSFLLMLAMLSGAGVFIFATIRYQFLDVRLVFRQSFVYTITSGILVGLYIFSVIKSKEILTPIFGEQAQLISYAFIIFILLLFQPINNWIDNFIRSMFIRTKTDHRNVLERFSRQVISQFDPKQLRQAIDETLKTALLVEKIYFILYDDEVSEYAILPSEDISRRIVINRDDMMLRGINLLDKPTQYSSLDVYNENSILADHMNDKNIRLIVPMKDAKHLLGFLALTGKLTGNRYSSDDLNLLGVLSNQMVTALTNARLYVESLERIRLQEEVSMARQIQIELLPSSPPKLLCSEIFVHSTPSRTIGGDFYDFIELPDNRIGFLIADASGKGMPAALMIALIQAIVRSELNNGNSIPTMLRNVNEQIVKSTSSEKYVTLFYGEINTKTGEFQYANAGHNYPVLVRANGNMELLKDGGVIIGALPDMNYDSKKITLNSDDLLFLFTDGLSEAMNEKEEEYTEERIRNFIYKNREMKPGNLVESILKDVRAYDPSDPPRDDTTIIALKMSNMIKKHEQ